MADIIVTLTIPDSKVTKVMTSFHALADTDLRVSARGSQDMPDGSDFSGSFATRVEPKGPGETNLQFGKRVIKTLLLTTVKMTEQAAGQKIRDDALAAVPDVVIDVPDDTIL